MELKNDNDNREEILIRHGQWILRLLSNFQVFRSNFFKIILSFLIFLKYCATITKLSKSEKKILKVRNRGARRSFILGVLTP